MKAVILGATGLIGSHLTNILLEDDNFSEVQVIVRKPLELKNEKLKTMIFDFMDFSKLSSINADVLFVCIGTTIKTAGSKIAFERVDYEIPLSTAKVLKENGLETVCLVSSMGASANSSIFYSKVKGKIEEALIALNLNSTGIFRPSLLLGDRKEHRFAEKVSETLMSVFDFMIPKKYKAISAEKVASSMRDFSLKNIKGVYVFESDRI